uniref:Uncharacterized protein n=1 Tax=viral metagenome TaxID=1070528 RepID=A0A6M3LB98_9ZZZZ
MYTMTDFKTKKQLKETIARGQKLRIYQPGGVFAPPEAAPDYTGKAYREGPHYPKPHTWYAEAWLEGGIIVKVK